jgi:single stranded DNA-binding protein
MIHTTVTGNLGKDAETRQVGDDSVTSFSIASNEKVKGEKITTWVRASIWGKRGSALAQYLTSGTKVCIVGTASLRSYQGKDGASQTSLEVRVIAIDLMGGGGKGGEQRTAAPARKEAQDDLDGDDVGDSEIPF